MFIKPKYPLARYISHYMVIRLAKGQRTYLPATYTPTLVITRQGSVALCGDSATMNMLLPPAYIEGPTVHPRHSYANTDTEIVSVHFKPAMLHSLLCIPTSEFSNSCIPLIDLPAPHLAQLIEAVTCATRINKAVNSLELQLMNLLLSQQAQRPSKTKPLNIGGKLAYKPTREIASVTGLSVRQLERRFMASYGVTIRDWRRLNRAANAVISLVSTPPRSGIASVAYDSNYFDHAHMCRDFREFLGVSPQEFSCRLKADTAYWPLRMLGELLSPNVASVQEKVSPM